MNHKFPIFVYFGYQENRCRMSLHWVDSSATKNLKQEQQMITQMFEKAQMQLYVIWRHQCIVTATTMYSIHLFWTVTFTVRFQLRAPNALCLECVYWNIRVATNCKVFLVVHCRQHVVYRLLLERPSTAPIWWKYDSVCKYEKYQMKRRFGFRG